MEFTDFQKKIKDLCPEIELHFEESMTKHTSFRIGGPAEVMAFPKSKEELCRLLKVSAMLDIIPAILGAGTNVLASDTGIPGLVICLKDGLTGMEVLEGNKIRVMSGVTMSRAAVFAAYHGLSGMEFAHGIPGTVGGGVYMNAGAYDGDISKILVSAEVMHFDGSVVNMSREALELSYRHSVLEDIGGIVISAVFQLIPAAEETVRAKMKELLEKRIASQPLDLPSAGSAFKRPAGGYAAALIQEAGLKGYQVGKAGISAKHAGFAVNLGGATADDVKRLLTDVSDKVYAQSGIRLEPEIRIW